MGTHSLMKRGRLPQLQCHGHKAHYPNFLRNILTPGHSVRVSQLRAASQNHISLQSSSPGEKSASATRLFTYRHGKVKKLHINGTFLQCWTMNSRSGLYSCHVFSIPKHAERNQTGCEQPRRRQIFIGYSYELRQWQAVLLLEEIK